MNIIKSPRLFKAAAVILAILLLLPFLVSCDKNSKSVLTVDGFEVPYHIYRYVVINSRRDLEAEFGEGVWKSEKADEVKKLLADNVRDTLANLYTVCSLGRDYSLTWDSGAVDAQANVEYREILSEYDGKNAFKSELEALAMTEDTFLFVISNDILNNEVFNALISSDKKYTDTDHLDALFAGDEFIRVKQILVGGENGNSDEKNAAKASQIKERLDLGEDFDKLSREYNNDLFMFENDDGYYIMRGTRSFEFEEAAFALEVGEISDVVKTDAGYSIIKRYEKDADYISENYQALCDEYYESVYTALYEERYDKIMKELTELPGDIDLITME